uniref:Thymosin beta n=1 Tax=Parasteatoda tepidariorum TaxID=114398 RepID=A0A2L2Y2P4_PARTP
MASPTKEELPKVSSAFKNELEKFDAGKMKHADTKEKNPLPSKEDVLQEKQHHELLTGVSTFNKAKLKRTNTKEKIVLPTKEVCTVICQC